MHNLAITVRGMMCMSPAVPSWILYHPFGSEECGNTP